MGSASGLMILQSTALEPDTSFFHMSWDSLQLQTILIFHNYLTNLRIIHILLEQSKEIQKCFGFSAQTCCQRIRRPDILAFRSGRIATTPAKCLQSPVPTFNIAHLCFTDGNTDMETQQRLCQKHALIFLPSLR